MLKKLFGLALALLATLAVSAQVRVGEGQLSGSFESNSIYYQDDSGLGVHSTGHWPAHSEIDASIIYADYYYIEALLRLKRLQEGKGVLG